jgi:hypothetical protein
VRKFSWVPGTFSGQGDALIFDLTYQPKIKRHWQKKDQTYLFWTDQYVEAYA